MKTISDLGREIKEDYPDSYDDLSDEEVGRMAKSKNPNRYRDYEDTSMMSAGGMLDDWSLDNAMATMDSGTRLQGKNLNDNLEILSNYYQPNKGILSSWWQKVKSQSRTDLLQVVTHEQLAIITQGAQIENALREGRVKAIEFNRFLIDNAVELLQLKAKAKLIQQSSDAGVSQAGYHKINEDAYSSETRIKEASAMSDIKVDEYSKLSQIDLDRKIAEAENTVRISIINKFLSEHQKIDLIQGLIDNLYTQINGIDRGELPDSIKTKMIADRVESIEAYKRDKRVRQSRLGEANNGEEV